MARRSLPPGRQIYDQYTGMRVGGLAGALIGGGVSVMTAVGWFVLIGAVVGAVAGYLWESRAIARDREGR